MKPNLFDKSINTEFHFFLLFIDMFKSARNNVSERMYMLGDIKVVPFQKFFQEHLEAVYKLRLGEENLEVYNLEKTEEELQRRLAEKNNAQGCKDNFQESDGADSWESDERRQTGVIEPQ